jgi:hypothetical protein
MYSEANWMDYSWWIENIARWLPELRWAYIPLTEDSPFAMFVARENDKALVDTVRSELDAKGIYSFALDIRDDTVSWPKGEDAQENSEKH